MPKATYVLYGCVYIITYRAPAIERQRREGINSQYPEPLQHRQWHTRCTWVRRGSPGHPRLNNTQPAPEPTHREGLYCTHRTRQTAAVAVAGTRTLPARHTHSTAAVGTPHIPSQLQGQGQMPPPVVGWDRTHAPHETG